MQMTTRLMGSIMAGTLMYWLTACGSADPSPGSPVVSGGDVSGAAISEDMAKDFAGTNQQPPSSAPTPTPGKNIWIIVCGKIVTGCQVPAEAAQEAGAKLGWKVTIVDGNLGVGDAFNNGIRQAIAAKADAIGLFGVDCSHTQGSLQQAATEKIPTFAVGSFDCDNPHIGGQPLFTASLQPQAEHPKYDDWLKAWGAAKARWLAAKNPHAKIIVLAQDGALVSRYPIEGFLGEMKTCPGCEIVQTLRYNTEDMGSGVLRQKFASALVAHREANAVVSPFDSMIQLGGIAQAVSSSGRNIDVVGGEGLAVSLQYIRDRRGQSAAIAYSMGWLGYGAIDTVNRIFAGQEQVPQGWGWQTVDVAHNLPAPGKLYEPSVDYRAAYLKAWGVGT
jgi:ribose transport system substrate-binding protein